MSESDSPYRIPSVDRMPANQPVFEFSGDREFGDLVWHTLRYERLRIPIFAIGLLLYTLILIVACWALWRGTPDKFAAIVTCILSVGYIVLFFYYFWRVASYPRRLLKRTPTVLEPVRGVVSTTGLRIEYKHSYAHYPLLYLAHAQVGRNHISVTNSIGDPFFILARRQFNQEEFDLCARWIRENQKHWKNDTTAAAALPPISYPSDTIPFSGELTLEKLKSVPGTGEARWASRLLSFLLFYVAILLAATFLFGFLYLKWYPAETVLQTTGFGLPLITAVISMALLRVLKKEGSLGNIHKIQGAVGRDRIWVELSETQSGAEFESYDGFYESGNVICLQIANLKNRSLMLFGSYFENDEQFETAKQWIAHRLPQIDPPRVQTNK